MKQTLYRDDLTDFLDFTRFKKSTDLNIFDIFVLVAIILYFDIETAD